MRIAWRIIVVLVLVAAMVGLGAYAYNAGMANGLAQKVVPQGVQSQPVPYPYYWHPFFGFGGFGFLGCLIPLFLLFLFFGSMRMLFWHGPMGWRRHGPHGPWGWRNDPEGKGVPPFFEEWHKRAHGESQDKPEEK